MEKACPKCGMYPASFYKDKNRSDGLDTVCKQCRSDYQQANKDLARARRLKYEAKRREQKRNKFIYAHLSKATVGFISRKSISVANLKGYPQLAPDLTSSMLMNAARGINQTFGQALVDILRSRGGRRNTSHHHKLRRSDHFGHTELAEHHESKGATDDYQRLIAEVMHTIKKDEQLSPREKRVLILRYKWGLTQEEIGELEGVSESRINQIETEAMAFLKSISDTEGHGR
jgi:RNA polymerase sigma factor (sigma-70 family)